MQRCSRGSTVEVSPVPRDRGCDTRHASGGAAMTLRRLRQDMTVSAESPDITEATDSTDPTDNADAADTIDPMDRTEPIYPIDSTDPLPPMQRIESSERIDHFDVRVCPTSRRSCHCRA